MPLHESQPYTIYRSLQIPYRLHLPDWPQRHWALSGVLSYIISQAMFFMRALLVPRPGDTLGVVRVPHRQVTSSQGPDSFLFLQITLRGHQLWLFSATTPRPIPTHKHQLYTHKTRIHVYISFSRLYKLCKIFTIMLEKYLRSRNSKYLDSLRLAAKSHSDTKQDGKRADHAHPLVLVRDGVQADYCSTRKEYRQDSAHDFVKNSVWRPAV